jgi:hypothetical protein
MRIGMAKSALLALMVGGLFGAAAHAASFSVVNKSSYKIVVRYELNGATEQKKTLDPGESAEWTPNVTSKRAAEWKLDGYLYEDDASKTVQFAYGAVVFDSDGSAEWAGRSSWGCPVKADNWKSESTSKSKVLKVFDVECGN